jgi:hypothetical protein
VLLETILRQPVVGADPDKRRHLAEWIRVYSITRWPSFAAQLFARSGCSS